jgi:mannan endo-1,4-beta-mannosidase
MRALDRSWRRPLAVLAGVVLFVPLVVTTGTAHAQTLVTFDFEDGVAGWQAPDWLESNAGPVSASTEQVIGGAQSLALPVSFPAGVGWAQAGAVHRFDQPFSASGTATFRVYAPVAGLSARFQFNDPWTEPVRLQPLQVGWNEVGYDIDADFAAPVSRVHEIILFVVAQNLPETFEGPVFFDDVAFTAGEPQDPPAPDEEIGFDFEDGVTGWTAPDWLGSNAGTPFQDDAQAHGGGSSLALPVRFAAASGWEQSGAVYRFPDAPKDISDYVAVSFHVYAPIAGLSARFQFNDPWTEPATGVRPLQVGWNQLTYDIGPTSADFPGGISQANEIILFVVAQNLPETFEGTVWFDDVEFIEAAQPIVFDFEENVDGWFAPDWLSANNLGQPVVQDTGQVANGAASLALPVVFPAGSGFEQAGAVFRFPDAPVDLLGYESVRFHVFAPVAGLSADLVFNDPWNPPTGWRPLAVGWNELTFDITPASTDWPGGVTSANEFIIRIIAQNLTETYDGPIWIDFIQFLPGTTPILSLVAPQANDVLSVPLGETYQIEVRASAFGARQLASVAWRSPTQQGTLSPTGDGTWTGAWDIWAEGEGVSELAVTVTDDEGESSTVRAPVLIRNSGLAVEITQPAFDAQLSGTVEVVATVTEDERFDLAEVVLYGLENDLAPVPMTLTPAGDGAWTATASLDTTTLPDGVESLAVEARDAHFAVRDLAHVIVRNGPFGWDFVDTEGTSFVHQGEPFRYVGANEYELFTTAPNFGRDQVRELDETIFGEVRLPGTTLDWREQIDRQMLEAARNGLTVIRTWAFNRNNEDSAFQRMVDGEVVFQESTFQRLDYVLDSARRHGIRVILTLENYWADYGGIGRAAQWLGLENRLQFFTDPDAIALYRRHAEHLITRVNTVNGVRYADDPTVFAWELMNEPRTDCAADPTPDRRFCDPTGQVMRRWVSDQAGFIKSLAPHHLVSPGSEAHGWIPTPSGGIQYGGPEEGNNNIPFYDVDVPEVDFLTFHPYPNASWAGLTKQQTRELVVSLTRMGVERGKPVVMEEWGIHRTEHVYTDDGVLLEPTTPGFEQERRDHYRMMIEACYRHGCAGSNVWMIADWGDRALNINLYQPGADAARDAGLVAELRHWAELAAAGELPAAPAPSCEVRYVVNGDWPDGFNAQVWVTNTGDTTLDQWRLGWWFEGGQEITDVWGAETTREGALVTADSTAWNGDLAPGESVTFGFIGTADQAANPAPKVFTVNGEVCTATTG